jgi:hypothetical protein
MPYAPDGNTCKTCKFYDVPAARCHQRPPPFEHCGPNDGCGQWVLYSGAARPLPTNPGTPTGTLADAAGYTA